MSGDEHPEVADAISFARLLRYVGAAACVLGLLATAVLTVVILFRAYGGAS